MIPCVVVRHDDKGNSWPVFYTRTYRGAKRIDGHPDEQAKAPGDD